MLSLSWRAACIWHVPPSTAGSRSRRATLFSGWGHAFASGRREGQGWSLHPGCQAEACSCSARLQGKVLGLASLWGTLSGLLETGEQVHRLSVPGPGLHDRPKAEAGPDGCRVLSSGRQTCARRPVVQTRPCRTRRVCRGQTAQGCRQLLGPAPQTRSRLPWSPVSRRHVLPAGTR